MSIYIHLYPFISFINMIYLALQKWLTASAGGAAGSPGPHGRPWNRWTRRRRASRSLGPPGVL